MKGSYEHGGSDSCRKVEGALFAVPLDPERLAQYRADDSNEWKRKRREGPRRLIWSLCVLSVIKKFIPDAKSTDPLTIFKTSRCHRLN